MTDKPKTTALTPAEWKQLCLLNVAQLSTFLQSIQEAPNDQDMELVAAQIERGGQFLKAWKASVSPPASVKEPEQTAQANGAEPPKRKRGRPPKVQPEQAPA